MESPLSFLCACGLHMLVRPQWSENFMSWGFLFILRWYLFAELDNIQSRGLANFMNHMHMLQHFTRFNVETYSLPPHVPYIQCTCSILAQITVVAICVKKSICRVHTYSCWDKDSKGKRKHKAPSLAFHSICNRKCLLYRFYH